VPPQGCEKHLSDLVALAPELCDSLLQAVDQPLKVAKGLWKLAFLILTIFEGNFRVFFN